MKRLAKTSLVFGSVAGLLGLVAWAYQGGGMRWREEHLGCFSWEKSSCMYTVLDMRRPTMAAVNEATQDYIAANKSAVAKGVDVTAPGQIVQR